MSTPATGGQDHEDPITALGEELARARNRGLDDLDLQRGGKAIATPILERLARTYCDDWMPATARGPLISLLLTDALTAWERAGHRYEAGLVRRLFFAPEDTKPADARPGPLMDAARKASGRSPTDFEKHRRAVFRLFAQYLIEFVELGARAAVPSTPPAPALPSTPSRRWARWPLVAVAAVLGLGIGAALMFGLRQDDPRQAAAGAATSTVAANPAAEASATFRFDALGGGSAYIRVFPGVGPDDLIHNGTFMHGQTAPAVCQTTGRPVISDPTVGERRRESDVWVQIIGSPGLTQFAPLTYGDIEDEALAALPQCVDVP